MAAPTPIVSAAAADGRGSGVSSGSMEPLDPATVVDRLAVLRREHRELDEEIGRRVTDLQADELTIKRLKKRKLQLKDCIARLESALIPDEPA